MKKFIAVLLVVFMALCAVPVMADGTAAAGTAAPAEKVQSADNIVSANVLSFLIGFFNVAYERKIFDYVGLRVRGMDWALVSLMSAGYAGMYGIGVDLFIYPQGKACRGFYLGPRYDYFTIGGKDSTGAGGAWNLFMAGGQAGYRWIFDGGFAMGVSVGAWANVRSYWTLTGGGSSQNGDLGLFKTALPTVDFDLGYAF
jgi:hypothetical protein